MARAAAGPPGVQGDLLSGFARDRLPAAATALCHRPGLTFMSRTMNPEAELQPPFAGFMGMKITHVSPDKVTAEMVVRDELNNRNGTLHGGAVMALADNLGGNATVANLPAGRRTGTIESKT